MATCRAAKACATIGVAGLALLSTVRPANAAVFGATTSRVSLNTDGTQMLTESVEGAISASGRYVAFSALEGGVALRDRLTGTTTPVADAAYDPSISSSGRFVAFDATPPLTPNAPLNAVYVRDMLAGTTQLVSVSSAGAPAGGTLPAISADGQHVAFLSPQRLTPGAMVGFVENVYVRNLVTRTTELASARLDTRTIPEPFFPEAPDISADGRFVAFSSVEPNLVPNDTNNARDVFVRDRWARTTTRVSVSTGGTQGNHDSGVGGGGEPVTSNSVVISDDGRVVAFESDASNLVAHDADGTAPDVFVRDRATGVTRLVSRSSSNVQASGGIDGIDISGNGRFVVFVAGPSLVPDDTNGRGGVFVRDRWLGTTKLVSVAPDGQPANYGRDDPAISDDGRHIAFSTRDPLVAGDTNDTSDVYVRDAFGDTP